MLYLYKLVASLTNTGGVISKFILDCGAKHIKVDSS